MRGSREAFLGAGTELSTGVGQGHGLWWKAGWCLLWRPPLPGQEFGSCPTHLRRFGVMPGRWWWSGRGLGGAKAMAEAGMMTEGEQDIGGCRGGGSLGLGDWAQGRQRGAPKGP